jgi:dipeptidyl aminopeptidase/acylaminoacyl peptidase
LPLRQTFITLELATGATDRFTGFNVLQLRKVPSELLVFPDEGHTVLKPANSKQWYEVVLGWCDRWAR